MDTYMYTLSKPEIFAMVKKSLLIYPWQIHVDVWQNQYNIVSFSTQFA